MTRAIQTTKNWDYDSCSTNYLRKSLGRVHLAIAIAYAKGGPTEERNALFTHPIGG